MNDTHEEPEPASQPHDMNTVLRIYTLAFTQYKILLGEIEDESGYKFKED
jgi:hypothetical protein